MSYTQQSKFPVLKEMLLLEDSADHDITVGLKKVLTDIGAKWNSGSAKVKQMHGRNLKKLKPEQLNRLKTGVSRAVELFMKNPRAGFDVSPITTAVSDKDEAKSVISSAYYMAQTLKEINGRFLRYASGQRILDAQETTDFLAANNARTDFPIGPTALNFVNQHIQYFQNLLVVDNQLGFDEANITAKLSNSLEKTPEDKKKEAVIGTHYFLHKMAVSLQTLGESTLPKVLKDKPDAPEGQSKPPLPAAT